MATRQSAPPSSSVAAAGQTEPHAATDLERTRASLSDDGDFAAFGCWDGNDATPWIEEAENYVRGWVLREAEETIAFRDRQRALVAVSAFNRRAITFPPTEPLEHPGWHLVILAIALDHQQQGLCMQVFEGTFAAMRQLDASRVYVTANVHNEHRASIKACAAAGLTFWLPKDDHYSVLFGEVPPA